MRAIRTKYLLMAILVAVMSLALTASASSTDSELAGTWAWDHMHEWVYVFNADGTGTRGVEGEMESFTWTIAGTNELRLDRGAGIPAGEIRNERWTYSISGDVLTIDSLQEAGMSFSYIRQ